MCVLVLVKDNYEQNLEWLKSTQKLYNNKSTQIVLIEALCYLEELSSLGVNYDNLPQIVYYDYNQQTAFNHKDFFNQ